MIIAKLYGGIGNQMFQYAAAKRLALVNNTELKLDLTHYNTKTLPNNLPYRSFDLSIFNFDIKPASPEEIALYTVQPSGWFSRLARKVEKLLHPRMMVIEPHFHFYPLVHQLEGAIYLDGYWQSEKYFKDIESIIRQDFEIKHDLDSEGQNVLLKIKETNSVCLNVRRQEFATNHLADQYFVGKNYLDKAVDLIEKKVDVPHFFIFSDDLDWCKSNLKLKGSHTFVEEHLYGEKYKNCLYLMTSCKHFIIPNSTFGWWAAWLGAYASKIVIAPQKWLKGNTKDTKDVLPEAWIKI